MSNISANQRWKESGTDLSFKEWIRDDFRNQIWQTVDGMQECQYLHADGSPSCNYQPTLSGNTILGINKYAFYGVGTLVVVGVGFLIFKHSKKNK